MRHYVDYVLNASGVPISGATVDVRVANASPGSGALATIYSDDGVTVISNPVTTDSTGTFAFYVADGRYDLVAKVGGVISRIVADIEIADVTQSASGDAAFNIRTLAVSGDASVGGNLAVTGAVSGGSFTPAPVVLSPGGDQAIFQPGTSNLLVNRFEQIRFADQFLGATVTNKLDAAFADLGGVAGLVIVPATMGAGLPTTIPTLGVMLDLRNNGVNPSTGFSIVRTHSPAGSGQVLGVTIEQGLNPAVDQVFLNFGQATELFTFASNSKNFSGSQQSVYGSFSHYGSGTTNGLYGGAFECFNSGSATTLLVVGCSATANNGGVNSGVPIQTAANNGNTTVLRAFDGIANNFSSGTVTTAVNFYAEGIRNTGGGSIVSGYGLLIADITGATNNFAIQTGRGQVVLGSVAADTITLNGSVTFNQNIGLGTAPITTYGALLVPSSVTGLTAANAVGMGLFPTASSAAIFEGAGLFVRCDTANAAFVQALNCGIHVTTPIKGAASTITEWNGIRVDAGPTAGTKFAIKTVGTEACSFGGALAIAGQFTSTLATGTAPLVVASTTNVANLNASSLNGATFAAPGAIGSGTPSTGAFTTVSATGQVTSTLATGTAPLVIASTTVVPNLNVQVINGVTISGAASAGQAIVATSASAASWANVPARVATIDTTGLTANVGAATLLASGSVAGGQYQVSAYVVETTAASGTSTMPNIQVIYTDADSNVSVTLDATPVLGAAGLGQSAPLTNNVAGTVSSGVITINVKAATTIQYQTINYASVAAGMTYAIHLRLNAI